jgi:hypothetical protein
MFSFLSGLIESRDKWLQQSNTVVNTAPYLKPDLSTKLISNTYQILISDLKIDTISNK